MRRNREEVLQEMKEYFEDAKKTCDGMLKHINQELKKEWKKKKLM